MSLNARALVGVLFTPGLLDNEIDHIVGGKEVDKKKEGQRGERIEKECGSKAMKKIDMEGASTINREHAVDTKEKMGSQLTEGDENKTDREEQIRSGEKQVEREKSQKLVVGMEEELQGMGKMGMLAMRNGCIH